MYMEFVDTEAYNKPLVDLLKTLHMYLHFLIIYINWTRKFTFHRRL